MVRPDGTVVERTGVSEQQVVHATIERREGQTWATRLGDAPAMVVALVLVAAAWVVARRSRGAAAPSAELEGAGQVD